LRADRPALGELPVELDRQPLFVASKWGHRGGDPGRKQHKVPVLRSA